MEKAVTTSVTIEVTIHKPVSEVWSYWNDPSHITKWCFAVDTWHAPWAENTLQVGGKYVTRMEAKDGSMGFDFWGVYDEVIPQSLLVSTLGDGRHVRVLFEPLSTKVTKVVETFDAEDENPIEMQREGWQAILNNFKQYTENHQTK